MFILIGLVGIDRALVAADQRIGHDGVVDPGRGEFGAADKARAFIHPDMCPFDCLAGAQDRLIAEVAFAALAGPGGIGIDDRSRPDWPARPRHCRLDQRGIQQRAAFHQQAALIQLALHLVEQLPVKLPFAQRLAKAAQRRMIRLALVQPQPDEVTKRQPIAQRFLQPRIGQAIPLLQQQRPFDKLRTCLNSTSGGQLGRPVRAA